MLSAIAFWGQSDAAKGDPISAMKEREEEICSQTKPDTLPPDPATQTETSTRRELIERYGKYAIVAAPLLVFVSKAHAIHSRP
jgi:hypothetical protein